MTARTRTLAAIFGILPASWLAYDAGILAIGTGYELVTGGPTASVLAFVWAVVGLIGYGGLWISVCGQSPNRWLVRVCILAGVGAAVPFMVMGQTLLQLLLCSGPIIVGIVAFSGSFRLPKNA